MHSVQPLSARRNIQGRVGGRF